MKSVNELDWKTYCRQELESISSILNEHNIILDDKQVHIGGERHLFSGKKLVLFGAHLKTKQKVIIKASSDPGGIKEIEIERTCRNALDNIDFASHIFFSPKELAYIQQENYIISVIEYIDQSSTFIKRDTQEQFFLTLKAFEAQEGVHATTYEHATVIKKLFGTMHTNDYLTSFEANKECVHKKISNSHIDSLFDKAFILLTESRSIIECYSGFLVHTDFVPHNIRIKDSTIYLLDHSSIRFGNKHEGWARFINFMTLYNKDLEAHILYYFKHNRSPLENESLRLMRIYRLGELVAHYANLLEHASGDLYTLTKERIYFWVDVFESTLNNTPVPQERIEKYITIRDSLRSNDEKERQKNLH